MIGLYDHVKIRKTGIEGIIVDVREGQEKREYTIESDEKGVPGGLGPDDAWKLFDCEENELEKLE